MGNFTIEQVAIFVIIIAGILYITYLLSKPKPDPEPPDPNKIDATVIELLKGGDAEEIAKREGISVEELNGWKDKFLETSLDYSRNRNTYMKRLSEREQEIEWFKSVCEKHIGSDWKEKTNYENRNR